MNRRNEISGVLPKHSTYPAMLQTQSLAEITRKHLPSLGDLFCFFAPALQFLQVQFVGTLQATDVIMLIAFPIAVIRHPERLRQKPVPAILTLGLLWLGSQIITDFVRHSAPEDYLRGWSRLALILVSFTVSWIVVCRSRQRFILYGVGVALGGLVTFYFQPNDQMLDSPWKFGLAGPITMLAIIAMALAAKHRYVGIVLPTAVLVLIHSYANTRSLAMICLLTAIYSLFHSSAYKTASPLNGRRLVILTGLVVLGIWGFTQLYSHYALEGVFGDYARQKLEAQTGSGGLLLGGRGEVLASEQAILDSPILGHGSWPRDSTYSAILAESRRELGYKEFQTGKVDDLIPMHSHIFGAWVEGGVAGAVFWVFVLYFAVVALAKVRGTEPYLPLFAFAGFVLVWDLLFSPISPERRFVTPYFMAAMVLLQTFRTTSPNSEWEI
jgi:hypothetical protein